jgi:hypothetical protein
LGVAAAAIAIACVDMSAPGGPASISTLQLPSPSVVAGDTMRDSNGVAQPITVIAFDANGIPTTGNLKLFITDTFRFARVTATNFLIGDSLGQTRLVGQVDGVQTQVTNVFVTLAPAKIVRTAVTADDTLRPPLGGDSASTIATKAVSVRLLSANDSASQGMIVRYRIVNPLAPRNELQPAAFITSGGKISSVDTTDQSGTASRDVTVIANFIADGAVRAGTKIDSLVVEVSAKYKGLPVPGSPLIISLPIRAGSTPATP